MNEWKATHHCELRVHWIRIGTFAPNKILLPIPYLVQLHTTSTLQVGGNGVRGRSFFRNCGSFNAEKEKIPWFGPSGRTVAIVCGHVVFPCVSLLLSFLCFFPVILLSNRRHHQSIVKLQHDQTHRLIFSYKEISIIFSKVHYTHFKT